MRDLILLPKYILSHPAQIHRIVLRYGRAIQVVENVDAKSKTYSRVARLCFLFVTSLTVGSPSLYLVPGYLTYLRLSHGKKTYSFLPESPQRYLPTAAAMVTRAYLTCIRGFQCAQIFDAEASMRSCPLKWIRENKMYCRDPKNRYVPTPSLTLYFCW